MEQQKQNPLSSHTLFITVLAAIGVLLITFCVARTYQSIWSQQSTDLLSQRSPYTVSDAQDEPVVHVLAETNATEARLANACAGSSGDCLDTIAAVLDEIAEGSTEEAEEVTEKVEAVLTAKVQEDPALFAKVASSSSISSEVAQKDIPTAVESVIRGHYQARRIVTSEEVEVAGESHSEASVITTVETDDEANVLTAGRDVRLQQRLDEHGLNAPPEPPAIVEQLHAAAFRQPPSHRGIYLRPASIANSLDEYMDAIQNSGGNALIMDVKTGYVYFHSTSELADEIGIVRPLYDLPEIVQKAKARGLYTMARYVAVKDASLAVRRPQTRMRHPVTGVAADAVWVDPAHPMVLEVNRQILKDVALSGIDEINLDYIRYPTEHGKTKLGIAGRDRAARVVKFIEMAREVIDENAPHVKLGLSTFAILGWDYELNLVNLGQDVVAFAPLVDVISPMAYPSTFSKSGAYYNPAKNKGSREYHLVWQTLEGYKKLLGDNHSYKIRPWIQGYYMSVQNIKDQMQATFDAGSCGFTVWSAGNIYPKFYAALSQIEVPARCIENTL